MRDDAINLTLGRYAACTGTDRILFTCSAFGPCIEAVANENAAIPVLKPNEAMIDEAAKAGRRIGLVSTFAPTLASMPADFPPGVDVVPILAQGALAELDRGNGADGGIAAAGGMISARDDASARRCGTPDVR
jgi:hypothetical protein